ncbi:tetratricopeptide repeat protein [Streptomyces sp. NPDC004050]
MSRDRSMAYQPGSQRSIPRPRTAPGALANLKHLLYELYVEAGSPPVARLSELIGADDQLPGAPSKDTIHRIIGSKELPPRQADAISVSAVLARAAGWDPVHTMEQVRQAWVAARLIEPLGLPVADLDPFTLEVHRSIEAEEGSEQLTLPSYVPRDHDRELRNVVKRAVGGVSAMATLTGGSSTGKTRALWEALQYLPPSWRVWQPLDSGRLDRLLADLDSVGPRTVIWLNEAQRALFADSSGAGELAGAALRRVLGDRSRAPVLVLATLWPEYWSVLTAEPCQDGRDPHAHARYLLDGTAIRVPEVFAGQDLGRLVEASTTDRRLELALSHADEGHITQYLAGVPALLQRRLNAPAPARALIDAAMDLRRLGHSEAIALDLLEQAACAYMTDLQFELLSDDWLEKALAYAAEPQRGTRGPLTRIRSRVGRPTGTTIRYRLADPLDHVGRKERRYQAPPALLWECLVAHASPADSHRLGLSAEESGLPHTAMTLYRRAATKGNAAAALDAAQLLELLERYEEALEWYEAADRLGSPQGLRFAAYMCACAELWDRATDLCLRSARSGQLLSLLECADFMWELGYPGDPDEWLDQALVDVLDSVSFEDALQGYRRTGQRAEAGRMLLIMGRRSEGLSLLRECAADGDFFSANRAAAVIEREEGTESLLKWLVELAGQGGAGAIYPISTTVKILKEAGRVEEAIELLKAWGSGGDTTAAEQLVKLLTELGRIEEADDWLQQTCVRHPAVAWQRAELLLKMDRTAEAEALLRVLATSSVWGVPERLAELLEKKGRADEAVGWYRVAAEADAVHAVSSATRLMISTGRAEEALHWLRTLHGPDSVRERLECAEWALTALSRAQDAARLRRFGWEPDGSIATPWCVPPRDIP